MFLLFHQRSRYKPGSTALAGAGAFSAEGNMAKLVVALAVGFQVRLLDMVARMLWC